MKCPFVIIKCNKCGKLLVAYEGNFYKRKNGKHGLFATCKICKKEYDSIYYKNNKEKSMENHKKWVKDNEERYKEYNKKYREEHKEHYKDLYTKYNKQYYREHKEECNKHSRQYYKENKDKILENKKQYYEDNPDIVFNNNIKRRQLEENQGNGINKEQWYEMFKFFNWCCAYSGMQLNKDNRSIDHIIPLSKGGLNEIWNCVPMLKSYNTSKYNKDMVGWYKEQEFFDIDRLMKIYEWQEYAFKKWGNKED